jgi:hypothetical protein
MAAGNWPSADDAELLRHAIRGGQLNTIIRRVYPQTDLETETTKV